MGLGSGAKCDANAYGPVTFIDIGPFSPCYDVKAVVLLSGLHYDTAKFLGQPLFGVLIPA